MVNNGTNHMLNLVTGSTFIRIKVDHISYKKKDIIMRKCPKDKLLCTKLTKELLQKKISRILVITCFFAFDISAILLCYGEKVILDIYYELK